MSTTTKITFSMSSRDHIQYVNKKQNSVCQQETTFNISRKKNTHLVIPDKLTTFTTSTRNTFSN